MPTPSTLTLRGRSTATHAQLQVHDTEGGIPVERLARIVEPLYTTKPGGTGLGLSMAQETVAARVGQISVESVPGQGTTLTITRPRATAATLSAS
jgi:signal transduction histidine kinase